MESVDRRGQGLCRVKPARKDTELQGRMTKITDMLPAHMHAYTHTHQADPLDANLQAQTECLQAARVLGTATQANTHRLHS